MADADGNPEGVGKVTTGELIVRTSGVLDADHTACKAPTDHALSVKVPGSLVSASLRSDRHLARLGTQSSMSAKVGNPR